MLRYNYSNVLIHVNQTCFAPHWTIVKLCTVPHIGDDVKV